MKRLLPALCLAFVLPAGAASADPLVPAPAPSQPSAVTFYPNEARFTVQERLKPAEVPGGGAGFVLTLPASTDQGSISVVVDGAPAVGWYFLPKEEQPLRLLSAPSGGTASGPGIASPEYRPMLPEMESDPKRRELLAALAELDDLAARKQGELDAVSERVRRLQEGPRPGKDQGVTLEEMEKYDAALAAKMPELIALRTRASRELSDVRERRARIENALEEYDQKQDQKDFVALVIPYGTKNPQAQLQYGYTVPGRASSSYRLNALPGEDKIVLEQETTLYHNAGFAIENAEISVSTARRDRRIQPGTIHPWTITDAHQAMQRVRTEVDFKASAPAAQVANMGLSKNTVWEYTAPEPVEEERSTFRVWNLGKRRVDDDRPVTMPLAKTDLAAKFSYYLSPSNGPIAFLRADVSVDKAMQLPAGNARFMVDNADIGNKPFSFNGDKAILYFGTDPLVTLTAKKLDQSAGEEGLLSKDQTYLYHWEYTLKNARAKAAEVTVEEAAPASERQDVTVEATTVPAAEKVVLPTGGAVQRWKLTLKPSETAKLEYKVRIAGPKDKPFYPGR